jgi:pyruvate/2-oxoglutarate/acetoin dehydrogenase E1 component
MSWPEAEKESTHMPNPVTMREAIRETVAEEMARNQDVVYIAIDAREGATGLSTGLVERFGKERIVNTPIAESSIVGMGIGAALMGLQPISEVMFEDFAMLAMDHLCNNMGTWNYLTNGQYHVPLTVICVSGSGQFVGAGHGHGQCLHPLFMSAPGVSVCAPATPYDARGLLRTALRGKNPVVYSVDTVLLGAARGEIPEEDYTIPFGRARVVRPGTDITVVAVGRMADHAEKSAAELETEGVSVEVIDPRTLTPLDGGAIIESVAKTGRLVVAEESRSVCGVGAEILALIASEDPSLLKAPAKRVAAPMIPIPAAALMEDWYLPSKDDIERAIRELMA